MFEDWVPKLINEENYPLEQAGAVIDSIRWRSLWRLVMEQGDDTTNKLKNVIDKLNDEVLSDAGGDYILSTPLTEGGSPVLSEQLASLYAAISDGTVNAATLETHDASYFATAAELTALEDVVDALALGEISAFNHNDIPNRDVAAAHPISAITGLADALAALGSPVTLAHSDLSGLDLSNAHPISAITGLSDSLSNIDYAIRAKQKAITTGTAAPSGGVDGDIYIRYA